jgi:branched-chain amino acid transport system permease protein
MVDEIRLFLEVCVSSLPAGSVYCLLALSYVLIFKATRLLNLCQGEIMMLGAYFFYSATEMKLSFINALILAAILTCFVALLLERVLLRKVMGEPAFVSIMVAVGIGILLRGIVGVVWGVDEKEILLRNFDTMVNIPGLHMNLGKFSIVIIAVVSIIVLELFFKFTKIGMAMKATASNRAASMIMGVNIGHVFSLSWLLAAIISIFPGIFLAKLTILSPTISLYGLIALSALVLGGVDSIIGTIVAGYAIGMAEGISVFYIGGQSKHLAGFIVMFFVLMIRPTGFFGIKKVERV